MSVLYKISQAITCSYSCGKGKKRKRKKRGRAERTSLEAPPKPVGRKRTVNIDTEWGKRKQEDAAFPTRLGRFQSIGKAAASPSSAFHQGCGAPAETAPCESDSLPPGLSRARTEPCSPGLGQAHPALARSTPGGAAPDSPRTRPPYPSPRSRPRPATPGPPHAEQYLHPPRQGGLLKTLCV